MGVPLPPVSSRNCLGFPPPHSLASPEKSRQTSPRNLEKITVNRFSGFPEKCDFFREFRFRDPDWIRIQLGQRIRIAGQNCVPKRKNIKNFMSEEFTVGPLELERSLQELDKT